LPFTFTNPADFERLKGPPPSDAELRAPCTLRVEENENFEIFGDSCGGSTCAVVEAGAGAGAGEATRTMTVGEGEEPLGESEGEGGVDDGVRGAGDDWDELKTRGAGDVRFAAVFAGGGAFVALFVLLALAPFLVDGTFATVTLFFAVAILLFE